MIIVTDQLSSLVSRFLQVAALAGVDVAAEDIGEEVWPPPHRATGLPKGYMAVYVFLYQGKALKVGKAGPNSDARYRSQHYNAGSAPSTLAASILKRPEAVQAPNIDVESVGEWIRQNTERRNYLSKREMGISLLSLLEAFIQCSLNPAYEGFESQQ